MEEKIASGIMLTLLLISVLTLAFNARSVKAIGTIYIRADGSIDPPTAPIQRDGDIYTFTDNINDYIIVERDNVVLDGAYHTGTGIDLSSRSNVTIKNMEIKSAGYGIWLRFESSNNTISGNNITNNTFGIQLTDYSSNNTISENNIRNNGQGIGLTGHSSDNTISGNNITNNDEGIALSWTNNNTISRNNVTANEQGIIIYNGVSNNVFRLNSIASNKYSFGVYGDRPSDFVNDVDTSNTVDGKPIYYWISKEDLTVPPDAGYVALVNCTRIKVENQNLAYNLQGALLAYTTSSKIARNNITCNSRGIEFWNSSNNIVCESNIKNNTLGIELWGTLARAKSLNNVVYHNNFVNNTVFDQNSYPPYSSTNMWDDGYPSGGNYWSDYVGVDEKSGASQDQLGSDGIGDTPHVIDASNRDRYPLMAPWSPPEHELSASVAVPASTRLGTSSFLNATVNNFGINDETDVEMKILINGTIKDSTTVSLLRAAGSYTLVSQWIPTTTGIYNVTAYVPTLPDEENTQNNQATEFVPVYASLPPVVFFTHSPTVPIVGETVTFDASGSHDPDGSIISYDWEFGDGATGSGETMTHIYATTGSYTVSLTITDNTADTATSDLTISVAPKVGVKAGDWIKIDYTTSGASSGSLLPQWLKVEFLNVEGTSAAVRVTMHMSDGTEQEETLTVDVVAGGQALGLSGFLIPANCTTGDCVYMTGYGNITIEGETTRTYAGASRTVVYASFSQLGSQLTYYWDKQTGVMVEASTTSGSMTATGKATETNMWATLPEGVQGQTPFWMQWWFYAIVAVVIVALAAGVYFLKKRKPSTPTAPSLPTEGS